ncbi:HAD family hydrolase [Trichloromonas sp.]|uniref:HAD family hydrolase n=1 Tax=Trichloromonas sp. TaxID=3069249 RepID=UPI003D813A4B
MLIDLKQVRSIVFDLDGTLYHSDGLAAEIQTVAASLVAETRGVSLKKGRTLLRNSRKRLAELLEEEPTLTRTCLTLGIEVPEFHRAMQAGVHPEQYLAPDPVLEALLDSLTGGWDLYLYTNNNLPLTEKILALLGVESLFRRLYTIEFNWTPKPDPETLQRVLEDIGGPPDSFLFVGDREQVDLKVPREMGIPTLLVAETADLLQIHKILGIIP